MASTDQGILRSVLVVGGGGFLGTFITEQLLKADLCTSIAVADYNTRQKLPNVSYHSLNIGDEAAVWSVLAQARPNVIFHLASPLPGAPTAAFETCNVKGTQNLLRCAKESQDVKALIYTSSIEVVANKDRKTPLDEENTQLWTASSKVDPYAKTKAIADAMVRKSNGPDLKTTALRVATVYGGTDAFLSMIMSFL